MRRQWVIPNRDAKNRSKKSMTEDLALEVIQVVSVPPLVVRVFPLLPLEEETNGALGLEEPLASGAPHPQLRRWEEEVKRVGSFDFASSMG